MVMVVWTGKPGAGKSFVATYTIIQIAYRNKAWFEKTGIKRFIYTNTPYNWEILTGEGLTEFFKPWECLEELWKIRDADVVWDEVQVDLDARNWSDLSPELKRWLEEHRKFGIEIYATAQDFGQVDLAARRCTTTLFWLSNLIGNREPSPTTPPIKYVWGLTAIYEVDPLKYDTQKGNFESSSVLPQFFWRTREVAELFSTRHEIKRSAPTAFKHIHRHCDHPGCHYDKVTHV